ncbi:DNA-binding response regulator [Streptomyces sp. NPDC127098]|uniref:response regulator transcription factor n=1 Tax=Streptomyces sp. NPDC127098 TaxID=3347137 RepID=UPI00364D5839
MVRTLIASDEQLIRVGVQQTLVGVAGFAAPLVCTRAQAVGIARLHIPRVVLISCPEVSDPVLRQLSELIALPSGPRTLLLVGAWNSASDVAALRAGAAGVLHSTVAPGNLIDAVRLLANGDSVLAGDLYRSVIGVLPLGHANERAEAAAFSLTERERQVLHLLAKGLSNSQIGRALVISPATVKDYLSSIYDKLGTRNRVLAAIIGHRCYADDGNGGLVGSLGRRT